MICLPTIKCNSCGAPIRFDETNIYVACEYCGQEVKVKIDIIDEHKEEINNIKPFHENILICSIPTYGSSIFQKKKFNIYREFAEIIDAKTGAIEHHIIYSSVKKKIPFMNSNIIFKMNNGNKITVKFLLQSQFLEAQQALNGLI